MSAPDPRPSGENLEAEIIRLAYSTVMDPSNLHLLLGAIESHVRSGMEDEQLDDEQAEDRAFRRIRRIETHLAHARDMMAARGGRSEDGLASRRSVLGDPQPAALLDAEAQIVLANAAAGDVLGLVSGQALPQRPSDAQAFSRDALGQLRAGCRALGDALVGQMVATVSRADPDDPDATTLHLSLVRVSDEDDRVLGRLGTVPLGWDEAIGARFQEAIGLSDAQLAVTRAVVSGTSLQALADKRGRKLSTVRNQLKQVYARTGVGSQVQLIALYSGYAQLSRFASDGSKTESGVPPAPHRVLARLVRRPDGRRLHVDEAGPHSGDPVLFFHAIVAGHTITAELDAALKADNIRLVMPWRPGWAQSDRHEGIPMDYDLFAGDIADLMKERSLKRFPMLADNMGGIHAFAVADALRRRAVSHPDTPKPAFMVWPSPALAIRRMRDMLHVPSGMRSYVVLGRYARPLLEAYVRFAFAKMDAGFDEEHIRSVYQDSPQDLDLLARPGVIEALRENFFRSRGKTLDAYVEDLALEISPYDWMDRLEDFPVHALVGSEHLATGEAWPRQHAERYPNFSYEMVPDTGSLLHLARPRLVTQTLRRWIDGDR